MPPMIERISQPAREQLSRVQAEATAANGWLVIECIDTFLLAGDVVKCHADAAEFTDDDGTYVVLPYPQIATVEIGHD